MTLLERRKREPAPVSIRNERLAERTAVIVRTELQMARDSIVPLSEKLAAAQNELTSAQSRFDAGVEAYAIGDGAQPDRAELQQSITLVDALRRVMTAQERSISQLAAELADAELKEAGAEEREYIQPLITCAEAKAAEYERAIAALRKAEGEFFTALFSESSGLKRGFKDPDVAREATRARGSLRTKATHLAEQFQYPLAANFETDGLQNLGAQSNPLGFLFRFFRTVG